MMQMQGGIAILRIRGGATIQRRCPPHVHQLGHPSYLKTDVLPVLAQESDSNSDKLAGAIENSLVFVAYHRRHFPDIFPVQVQLHEVPVGVHDSAAC